MAKVKDFHAYLIPVCAVSGWLLLLTGCDMAANSPLPVNLSNASTDLTIFVQEFAREALAAFLF